MADVPFIADVWTRAAEDLRCRGLDQWQYPVRVAAIRETVGAGTSWIIEEAGARSIGTVTLDQFADPRLWTPENDPDTALYLHRLVLDTSARGHEYGSAVLDWAGARAQSHGKKRLRLDAWTSNPGLHRYYLAHGFRHVRTVHAPEIPSGALFERDSSLALGHGPRVDTAEPDND